MRAHSTVIGNSTSLTAALEQLSRLAAVDRPALVIGERGTGKELAAERLHFLSSRWEQPLLKVNCAAISEELLESELFGHEQGAFTGATRPRRGCFERAGGGTLFLDELATMSGRVQEKLLRVIEYGEFERLGGQQTQRVNVRIVAATNANLQDSARRGRFREDLLDRLSFDVVHLPPLRLRQGDIEELARHFAVQMCGELGREYFPGFTPSALAQLNSYHWPGNIRELKNVIERSVYRSESPQSALDEIIIDPFASPYEADAAPPPAAAAPAAAEKPVGDFQTSRQAFERALLEKALRHNNYHQGRTAQALQLSYDQLRGLLRKYALTGKPTE